MRRERLQICADLVRDIAARRDAIRSDDDEIDIAALHEVPARIVGDEAVRNAVLQKLERRQRRALIARPRFVDPDVRPNSRIVRLIDRRCRRSPIDARKPAGIAVRQDVDGPAAFFLGRSLRSARSPLTPMLPARLDIVFRQLRRALVGGSRAGIRPKAAQASRADPRAPSAD